jgi:DnaJ-class molecular chaperone
MSRPTWETSHDRKECPTCNGEGVEDCEKCRGDGECLHCGAECSWCEGHGVMDPCRDCVGRGWVKLTDAEKESLGQRTLPL